MDYNPMTTFDFEGKAVLLRADLNVPVDNDHRVTDATRIIRLKPTIDYLAGHGARILILSHFGRPKGQVRGEYSLAFLPEVLKHHWSRDVGFAGDCIGQAAEDLAGSLKPGQVGLLENVRFHPGEEANDPDFVARLAALGDIFVHDAFSAAHRAHASTEGLAHILPTAAGFLMESEIKALTQALEDPERPVAAVVGGSKVSTKLSLLQNLCAKVDMIVLGGGMANTFLAAKGYGIGQSMHEPDMLDEARAVMSHAETCGCHIILPEDCVVVSELEPNADSWICPVTSVPDGMKIVDTGQQSFEATRKALESCRTVLWNGPLGVFEIPPFDTGTNYLARYVAERSEKDGLKSIAGGGDTVSALENAGVMDRFSYVSTAGGAFLEWLEGRTLPGIAALSAYGTSSGAGRSM